MQIKKVILVISIVFLIAFAGEALAQTSSVSTSQTTTVTLASSSTTTVAGDATSTEQEAEEMVNEDENVSSSELGVGEPTILPGNPFYFLKNWGHWIRSIFVFNPVKKAELMQKYANEKLLELERLEKEGKNPKVIARATDNYNKILDRLQKYTDKIENASSSQANKFMDKFVHQQMLHQEILDRLEQQVPTSTFQKIEQSRQRHLEMFKSVMMKLQNKKEMQDRLEKAVEDRRGSAFRGIQAIKVLNRLEEIVPEQAQDSIKKAKQDIIDRLQKNLEKMPPSKQGLLKDYLDKLSGDPEEHINIIQDITNIPQLQKVRDRAIQRMSERIEESAQKRGCPSFEKPQPGFCKEGRVVLERDSKGCPIFFKCISLPKIPFKGEYQKQCLFVCLKSFLSQTSTTSTLRKCLSYPLVSPNSKESFKDCLAPIVNSNDIDKCLTKCENFKREPYCPTLWDPVCGVNSITYPNSCRANVAGVKIAHRGRCNANRSGDENRGKENETSSESTTTNRYSEFPHRRPPR